MGHFMFLLRFTLLALLSLLLGSCSAPKLSANLPEISFRTTPSWESAIEVQSPHYYIKTDTDDQTAALIKNLMEAAYASYEQLTGMSVEGATMNVNVYSSTRIYEDHAERVGLSHATTGFFSPAPPKGIHIPLIDRSGTHPFFTLVHEGWHQYVYNLGYSVKNDTSDPEEIIKLIPIPLWMNEGLALYFEAALIDEKHLRPGDIHPTRLAHLKKLLRSNKAPRILDVINKTYGEAFTNNDYSVAWGLVQYFLSSSEAKRLKWRAFVRELNIQTNKVFQEFSNTIEHFPPIELQQNWANKIMVLSRNVFYEEIMQEDDCLENFEKSWRDYILKQDFF